MSRRTMTALILATGLLGFAGSGVCLTSELLAPNITWELSVNNAGTQTTILPYGGEFVLDADEVSAPGSEGLLDALDGIRFNLSTSSIDQLTIRLTLNVVGDSFASISGYNCFFNMKVETLVDGRPTGAVPFTLVVTIPTGAALDFVLDTAQCSRDEAGFAFYDGGTVVTAGITTNDWTPGLVVHITETGHVIGGKRTDLGIPASVGYSTWNKIKKLFE